MTAGTPRIQQALHGYRDGHRLLAMSVGLPVAEDRALLQTLSDSPDAGRLDHPALGGYPLPSASFYVLALTWPATDISRPGCVWTHSLLLDYEALALSDLGFALDLFRRPEGEESFDRYAGELQPKPKAASRTALPDVAATLLWSLYDPPCPPVEMREPALAGASAPSLLLQVFSQLPPEQRWRFSFAYAPHTARRIDRKLLDLQITRSPQRSSWEPRPDEPAARTISRPIARRVPDWCGALVEDLAAPGSLRAFLRANADSVPPTRRSVWGLASLFAALDPADTRTGYGTIPAVIGEAFPEPGDAGPLKRALFGAEDTTVLPFKVDQAELLLALAETGLPGGLTLEELDLERHGAQLLAREEAAALALVRKLNRPRPRSTTRALLEGIAQALSDEQIAHWSRDDPDTTASLAAQTSLGTRPALWQSSDVEHLWPAVRRPRSSRARRAAIVSSFVQARSESFLRAARTDWSDGSELLLDALASSKPDAWAATQLAELSPATVLAWLRSNGPAPAIATMLLDVWRPKRLARVPVGEWNALLESGGKPSDYTLALLLRAACSPDSGLGPLRATRAYVELWRRLSNQNLKKRACLVLHDAQPEAESTQAAAATMLASGFAQGKWPSDTLLSIADASALREVLFHDPSDTLAERLEHDLSRGADASREQAAVIVDAIIEGENEHVVRRFAKRAAKHLPWFVD